MKAAYRAREGDALALFARAPTMHLASVDPSGRPILRTVHGVVVDGRIAFHGGDHGDKVAAIGRPVVLSAEEIVAEIPSYFIDPERACPATTYYRSAMAHGSLRRVDDIDRKAEILQALMERYQPEGRYARITAADPRYRKALASLLVVELEPEHLSAKHKLGQNHGRQRIERILGELWRRGQPGDLRAIRVIREAHPGCPEPDFLRGPDGATLCCAPDARDARQAAEILSPLYWSREVDPEAIIRAQLGSAAWVAARETTTGRVIATARANADSARHGHVLDVAVANEWQGRGVGHALMSLLLDHPRVRDCRAIRLETRDAQPFYARFGFTEGPPSRYAPMNLRR